MDGLSDRFMMTRICLIVSILLTHSCAIDKKDRTASEIEPLFMNLDSDEVEYKKTVDRAQSELPGFFERLDSLNDLFTSSVKIFIPDSKGKGAFIWLIKPRLVQDSCEAEIFELPSDFENLKVGERLKFRTEVIHDWFILDNEGKMEGGYSLRYQRSKLSAKGQKEFDEYIGVKVYL